MSLTFELYNMIGVLIPGEITGLYDFLEKNGYPISERERQRVRDSEANLQRLIDFLGLEYMEVVRMNPQTGEDFFLGYNVSSPKHPHTAILIKKFMGFFPDVHPTYLQFKTARHTEKA